MDFAVALKARSRIKGYKAVFVDTIAVPGKTIREDLRDFFGAYSKFRIDLPKNSRSQSTKSLKVIEKIVMRGRVTRLSRRLEEQIGGIVGIEDNEEQKSSKELILELRGIYDSGYTKEWREELFDGEKRKDLSDRSLEAYFYEEILVPEVVKFGDKNIKDVIPQAMFMSLTGDETDDRRVDFLVTHGKNKIAFEIDDATHNAEQLRDRERDELLKKQGIVTVRISEKEIRDNSARGKVERALARIYEKYDNVIALKNRDFYLGVKLAHMVQVILVKLQSEGVECGNKKIWFDEKLLFGIEKNKAEEIIKFAISDLKELEENIAEIYNERTVFSGLNLDEKSDILVSRNGGGKNRRSQDILVEEISFSEPLVNYRNSGDGFTKIEEVKEKNLEFLAEYIFGYRAFRENQVDGIKRGLRHKDSIILLPTGSGKSLIYQFLMMIFGGTGVVVEPLKSLMEDQVENLRNQGIDNVVSVSGDVGRDAKKKIYEGIRLGMYGIIYVTPERLQMEDFRDLIHDAKENDVSFPICALDEAHCVSEWGHDFRVSYLNLADTARKLFKRGKKKPVVMALTGTASNSVLKDMERDLRIPEDDVIRPESFDRPEIHYKIIEAHSDNKLAKLNDILEKELPEEFGEKDRVGLMKLKNEETKSGVVFCVFKTGKTDFGVNAVYMKMRRKGWDNIVKYHGTDNEQELMRRNARAFKANKASLMIATKAFGMGIDKPNIRYTVHYGIPNSIEAYYQEAGRAGRDGEKAMSYIILSDDSPERNQELINNVLVEDLAKELKRSGKNTRDDVNRLLFLHQRNYNRDLVFSDLEGILNQIGALRTGIKRVVARDHEEFQNWQKTLFRLKVLKVINDYVISDYANNEFKVDVEDFEPRKIVMAYGKYVAQYQEGQAKTEMGKIKNKKYDNWKDFVYGAMNVLLDFTENVFESSRRRAIGNMLQLAKEGLKIKSPEMQDAVIRQKILNHLGNSCGNIINQILEDKLIMAEASRFAASIMRKDEAKLLAETRRTLQAYPEHPGLLLIAGVLGSIDCDTEAVVAANDIVAAIKNAKTNYKIKDYEKYVIQAIGETCRKNKNEEKYKKFIEKVSQERSDEFMEGLIEVLPKDYSVGVGARILSRYNLMMISEIRGKIGLDLWTKKN